MHSKTVQVSELVSLLKKGITPKYSDDSNESTIPVINQKCIRNFSVNFELCRLHDRSKRKVADDKLLQRFDVLINSTGTGTLGRVAQYFGANDEVTVDSHVAILRPNDDIDPIYFGYLIKSKQKIIETLFTGSTGQTELDKNAVNELECEIIADKYEQKRIGKILKALDDKIENNQPMNQTLEKIAQRIFKSWFIDFDPVKANKEGVPFDGLSPEIQALFPSEFEESELGMIPKGWGIEPIQKLSKVAIGKTPPRKQTQWFDNKSNADNTKWFSIKDMGTNGMYSINSSECLTNEAIDKFNVKVIPSDTVLLSFKLTLGRLAITTEECATNEAIAHFKLDSKHDNLTTNFIYYYMKNFNFNLLGSTSSIAIAINSKMVKEIPVLHSDKVLMAQFSKIVDPLMERIKLNSIQNDKLERIRDKLLPKLISGQISVSEAKQELAEAI